MGGKLISVSNASVTYRGVAALSGVSLVLNRGEHLVLRGGNGAGKSTLLRLLRGEQWPDQHCGKCILWHTSEGDETSPLAGRSMAALVAPAQQEQIISQGWEMTGEDLVLGGLTDARYVLRHANDEEHRQIVELAADLGAVELLERRVPEFSQGELRRLLVARALIRRPEVLLLDEVTDGLDAEARERLQEVLLKAASRCTLVISTHRPMTLPPIMRREVCMHAGSIVDDHPLPAPEETFHERKVSSSVGGHECLEKCRSDDLRPSARVEIRNATVYIARKPVLHSVSWTIEPGQNWVVIGENGAGKSTLMRLIYGDETPAWGGSIARTLAHAGGVTAMLADIRKCIRMVSDLGQATYTYDLTGEELVLSGIDNSVGLYRESTQEERKQAWTALFLMGVSHLSGRSIRCCSTGELRRMLIARSLVGSPDLIIFDEPCSGLDPAARDHFAKLVEMVVAQGVQIILVTHHEGDILPAITHELRLENGVITYCGPYRNPGTGMGSDSGQPADIRI